MRTEDRIAELKRAASQREEDARRRAREERLRETALYYRPSRIPANADPSVGRESISGDWGVTCDDGDLYQHVSRRRNRLWCITRGGCTIWHKGRTFELPPGEWELFDDEHAKSHGFGGFLIFLAVLLGVFSVTSWSAPSAFRLFLAVGAGSLALFFGWRGLETVAIDRSAIPCPSPAEGE